MGKLYSRMIPSYLQNRYFFVQRPHLAIVPLLMVVFYVIYYIGGNSELDLQKNFLSDGFVESLNYMQYEYNLNQFKIWSVHNIHTIRWLLFGPFIFNSTNELLFNDYFFYIVYCAPLLFALGKGNLWVVALLLLVMPMGMSFRSSLAAVGLTYISVFLLIAPRLLFLIIGFILISLSSVTIMQSFLLFLFFGVRGGMTVSKFLAVLCLGYFLLIQVFDKVEGVLSEKPGYISSANIEGSGTEIEIISQIEKIILNYIARSTIVVSYIEGQFRFYFYATVGLTWFGLLLWNFFLNVPIARLRRRVLYCLGPALALEGLGVLAMVPVLTMIATPQFGRLIREHQDVSPFTGDVADAPTGKPTHSDVI